MTETSGRRVRLRLLRLRFGGFGCRRRRRLRWVGLRNVRIGAHVELLSLRESIPRAPKVERGLLARGADKPGTTTYPACQQLLSNAGFALMMMFVMRTGGR